MIRSTIMKSTILILFSLAIPGYSQSQLLSITAPADGSTAHQGQTITVTLSVDPSLQVAVVLAENPLPPLQALSATQFQLTIPSNTPSKVYRLTAVGSQNGAEVESAPVNIDIEASTTPVKVEVQPTMVTFTEAIQQIPLTVLGTFTNSNVIDITRSPLTHYSSSDTTIATVTSTGVVQAVKSGKAKISVSTPGGQVWNIPTTLP